MKAELAVFFNACSNKRQENKASMALGPLELISYEAGSLAVAVA